MYPQIEEVFENGDVKLSVCKFDDPPHRSYWVNAGVAMVEFTEESFPDLIELLQAYNKAKNPMHKTDPWQFYANVLGVLCFVFVIVAIIMGG